MLPATRAVLREFQAVRVVPLVLLGVVRPLFAIWAGQGDQHPISLLCHFLFPRSERLASSGRLSPARATDQAHSVIEVTTPAPTVRPPSRIAKRSPSSTATGVISSICIWMLSPGITISTPSGN